MESECILEYRMKYIHNYGVWVGVFSVKHYDTR